MGIIGNTQGVSKAAKPDKKAIKKMDQSPFLAAVSVVFTSLGAAVVFCTSAALVSVAVVAAARSKVNSTSFASKL